MGFMKADKNMTVQDLIDELMLVKDKIDILPPLK